MLWCACARAWRSLLFRLLFQFGDLAAELDVFGEVAQVACHCFAVAFEGAFVFAYAGGDAHDRLVCLELCEGGFQDFAGAFGAVGGDEVCRHVVGGAE